MKYRIFVVYLIFQLCTVCAFAEEHSTQNDSTEHQETSSEIVNSRNEEHGAESDHKVNQPYDPAATAIHHISDANVYSILDLIRIPLPMILYAPDKGWDIFSSGKFETGDHEDGHFANNGYVLHQGSVHRVVEEGFPTEGLTDIGEHAFTHKSEEKKGKKVDVSYVKYNGKEYRLDARSTLDGGMLGGGITSFYDFSLSKNVLSMILVSLFLIWIFKRTAKSYKENPNRAPKGMQALLEPIFLFIRDEVAIPFIGKDKYMKFFPLLLSIFFFVLGLNLFGQIPFFGSTNVTGNLTVTMVLALLVFFIVNFNGKKDYWMHIFWMPNIPVFIKPLLAAVEIMGLFIKPLTLMMRLAGNIAAGHIAILSFIGLIFIFGNSGTNMGGGVIGTVMAIPLTLFMMAIELIVAFIQAYVFTILAASYIGAAIEEHHHPQEHNH